MKTNNIKGLSGGYYLIDSTLRDGEQSPGVVFNIRDKLAIASLLNSVGVEEVELGTPAMGKDECKDMRILTRSGFSFRTLAWCRALQNDLIQASKTGVNGVHISFPVSDMHMRIMGKTPAWVLENLVGLSCIAQDHFEYFSIGAQDASRANQEFLRSFALCASALGARRIRIADTVGALNPLQVQRIIQSLATEETMAELEFHAHNDLGMATANAITALLSGAGSVSVTVNGLGERAGNASLDEVIMALQIQENCGTHYNTQQLKNLSSLVEHLSGQVIPPNKPVVGEKVFRHESGIHVNGQLYNPKAYQLVEAESVGCSPDQIVYGKHSGKNGIKVLTNEMGFSFSDGELSAILAEVKSHSINLKRALKKEDIRKIILQLGLLTNKEPTLVC